MTNYLLYISLNLSVLLAVIVVIIRFRQLPVTLYPFVFLILVAALNELLSIWLVFNRHTNSINSNIYILLEFVLLTFQFYRWNIFSQQKYTIILSLGSALWIVDNFLLGHITVSNSLSRIAFAFLFVVLSIDKINRRIVFGGEAGFHKAHFLIVIGMLIYFACKTYVEVFNAFDLGFSNQFYANIWFSMAVVNALANILYAISFLCIQPKQQFSLQSSLRL